MELLNSSLMMQRSMDFLWSKQSCILSNLANAETPGYKPRYATFEDSLKVALERSGGAERPISEMRQALEDAPVEIHEAQERTRLDGNGVNVLDQSVELARNAYQLQYVMSAISSDFSTLRTAIRG